MTDKLDQGALAQALKSLPAWRLDPAGDTIRRGFRFADFVEAFGFMAQVALKAQAAGHHPDWSNSYNTVEIALSTHSAGGVTENDIELAKAIDALHQRATTKGQGSRP